MDEIHEAMVPKFRTAEEHEEFARETRWAEEDARALRDARTLHGQLGTEAATKKVAADMAEHYSMARENPGRVKHLRAQGNSEADIDSIVAWKVAGVLLGIAPSSVANSKLVRCRLAPLVTELRFGHEDAAKRVGDSNYYPVSQGPTEEVK